MPKTNAILCIAVYGVLLKGFVALYLIRAIVSVRLVAVASSTPTTIYTIRMNLSSMINTDEPQASAEGSIPAAPQSQHSAYPYPQPHPQSHPHSHPHSLIASHALTHPQSQGSEQPSVLPSVLQQPHSQPRQPLPQPHQLYKGLEKPHDHPSLNCWELPYIWAAITRFIPIVQHELLDGVRE